ncbi:MAG: hypothetical protein LBF24_02905 [Puniceicoccales bacterium]|nr:hypothetical protein [Puniceicoccales bacterium]
MDLRVEFYEAAADAAARGIDGQDNVRLHGLAVSYGLTAEEEGQLPTAIAGLVAARSRGVDMRGAAAAPSMRQPLLQGAAVETYSLDSGARPPVSLEGLRPCWKCFQELTAGLSYESFQLVRDAILIRSSQDREAAEVFQAFFDRDRHDVDRHSISVGGGGGNWNKGCRRVLLISGAACVVLAIVLAATMGPDLAGLGSGISGALGGTVLLVAIGMQVYASCVVTKEAERLEAEYVRRHGGCPAHPLS